MKKLQLKANSFVGVCNKVVDYVNAIMQLPPQGEHAKSQVVKEVRELFKQLNAQSKSLENALISVVDGRDGRNEK